MGKKFKIDPATVMPKFLGQSMPQDTIDPTYPAVGINGINLHGRSSPNTAGPVAALNSQIGQKQPIDWAKAANSITPFVSNIANAFRKPPVPSSPDAVSSVVTPRVHLDNQRNEINRATHAADVAANRSLDENSAAAVRGANLSTKIAGLSHVNETEANTNAGLQMQGAGMNASVDAMNTGARNQYKDNLTARKIVQQREQSANLANAADKHILIQNEKRKGALDLQKWQLMLQNDPDGVLKRFNEKMKKEGVTDPTGIISQMGAFGGKLRRVYDGSGFTYPEVLADGGVLGGGDDPKKKPAVYTSQAQIDKDNQFAKDFLTRHNAPQYYITNGVVARDIGDPVVKFTGDTPTPRPAGQTTLPFGVSINDVEHTSEGYGYWHPQNGNWVPVDSQAIYSKYGAKPVTTPAIKDVAKMSGGGYLKNRLKKLSKVYY